MESVLRALFIYAFLLVVFRITGKRSLAQVTTFDFVLLLIIGEATQQALLGQDYSLTNAALVIATLVLANIALSLLKARSPGLEKVLDGTPTILVDDGRVLKDRMERARVDEADVLEAARELRGIGRMDQVRYAVLERDGHISIIPKERPEA